MLSNSANVLSGQCICCSPNMHYAGLLVFRLVVVIFSPLQTPSLLDKIIALLLVFAKRIGQWDTYHNLAVA